MPASCAGSSYGDMHNGLAQAAVQQHSVLPLAACFESLHVTLISIAIESARCSHLYSKCSLQAAAQTAAHGGSPLGQLLAAAALPAAVLTAVLS